MTRTAPTAVLADDEPHLLAHLERELRAAWPSLDIAGMARSGREALALIERVRPDVAFLDIRMPGLTGLEIAERVPPETHVVFVTAYDEYAVEAFERAAIDYLLKPVRGDRLAATVARLEARLAERATPDLGALRQVLQSLTVQPSPTKHLDWLRVGKRDVVHLLPVTEIVYLEADRKYTTVFTADDEYLVRTSLRELEASLDPSRFWRIHRSAIVNTSQIAEARRDFRGRYVVTLKSRREKLSVSESYAHLFRPT